MGWLKNLATFGASGRIEKKLMNMMTISMSIITYTLKWRRKKKNLTLL